MLFAATRIRGKRDDVILCSLVGYRVMKRAWCFSYRRAKRWPPAPSVVAFRMTPVRGVIVANRIAVGLPAADALQARHPCLAWRAPSLLAAYPINSMMVAEIGHAAMGWRWDLGSTLEKSLLPLTTRLDLYCCPASFSAFLIITLLADGEALC